MLGSRLFRVTVILFLAVFPPIAVSPLFARDGEVPLDATLVSFSKATGHVEFDVLSHSETPVVAWDIKIVVRHSNGDEYVTIFGTDYWLAGSESYLENGGSSRGRLVLSQLVEPAELAEPPIELLVASAVFSDGRTAGEPHLLESIFLFRSGRLSEFCRIAAVFDAASREAHSIDGLKYSIRTAIDRAADSPLSTRSNNLKLGYGSQSMGRFRAGVLAQRQMAAEFLGALDHVLDSAPGDKLAKTRTRLRSEAASYHKYCNEASSHLRQSDLDLVVQPKPTGPDQRSPR